MARYTDIKKFSFKDGLASFETEIGVIIDGERFTKSGNHLEVFDKDQIDECRQFCLENNQEDTLEYLTAQWGL